MKKLILLCFVLIFSNSHSQWFQNLNGRSVWSFGRDKQNGFYAGGLTGSNSRIWKYNGSGWDTIYVGTGQTMWAFGCDTIGTKGNLYVANYSSGLLKSTNGGLNFTVIDISHFMNKNPQGVTCNKNGTIHVTTANGYFRSTNGGVSFDTALTGLNCLPVLIDEGNPDIVYVGVSGGTSGIGFYRSTNNGVTFSENLNPGKNGYNLTQAFGVLYMITTTSPYNFDKSTNQGLTWTTQGNAPGAMRGIAWELGSGLYIGGNGGVFKSTNQGVNWLTMNFANNVTPVTVAFNRVWAGVSGASGGAYYYTIPDDISNQSTLVTEGYALYQNYPNPFNPTTKIIYELKKSEFISLKIYDNRGNEIKELQSGIQTAGRHEINFSGENLSSGNYFVKLSVNGNILTKGMVLIK